MGDSWALPYLAFCILPGLFLASSPFTLWDPSAPPWSSQGFRQTYLCGPGSGLPQQGPSTSLPLASLSPPSSQAQPALS